MCGRSDLSGSRCKSGHKCVGQRHGLRRVQRSRRAGLSLWRGAQLEIDTTLVSPLSRDWSASRRAANHDGVARGEEGRRTRTPSCPGKVVGHAWLCWRPKLGVIGASRPRNLCHLSSKPRRNRHHTSSEAGCRLRGCAGGVPLWLALQHGPSRSPAPWCQGRVTPSRPLMRS